MTWDIAWCFSIGPLGFLLTAHFLLLLSCCFWYAPHLSVIQKYLLSVSFFFFGRRGSSPRCPQLDQMKVQHRLVRLLLVNSYCWTSVILVIVVWHCRHHEVRGKCGSQMPLHKWYRNNGPVYCAFCSVIKMIQILGMSLSIVITSNSATTRRSSLQHFAGKKGSQHLTALVCLCVCFRPLEWWKSGESEDS